MTWSESFRRYLVRRGIRKEQAAAELETSVSSIHYWLSSTYEPRPRTRERVERWSKGAVPATLHVARTARPKKAA